MRNVKRGFTLVELLVVIAIIGVLVALLLPAIQAAREAARRTQCNNNLKNIGLALQNYHDTYKVFPMGAMPSGRPANRMGPSWWYGILPFIEQRNIYDRIGATQRSGAGSTAIFTAESMSAAPGVGPTTIAQLVPEVMRCPSSPIPVMETQTGPICLSTYVGIAGGCDISANSSDYSGITGIQNATPTSTRRYVNQNKGSAPDDAIVTSSGMLPPIQHINMAGCTDGTSNTMIVSEQSDWLRHTDRTISTAYHGHAGWNPGGTAQAGGWLSGLSDGSTELGTAPNAQVRGTGSFDAGSGSEPGAWESTRIYNLTTVRYRPDLKQVIGDDVPGVAQHAGHNNPLQSPHPGGILVAFVDGSVQFVAGTQQLAVLLRIAIRDDGQNVVLD